MSVTDFAIGTVDTNIGNAIDNERVGALFLNWETNPNITFNTGETGLLNDSTIDIGNMYAETTRTMPEIFINEPARMARTACVLGKLAYGKVGEFWWALRIGLVPYTENMSRADVKKRLSVYTYVPPSPNADGEKYVIALFARVTICPILNQEKAHEVIARNDECFDDPWIIAEDVYYSDVDFINPPIINRLFFNNRIKPQAVITLSPESNIIITSATTYRMQISTNGKIYNSLFWTALETLQTFNNISNWVYVEGQSGEVGTMNDIETEGFFSSIGDWFKKVWGYVWKWGLIILAVVLVGVALYYGIPFIIKKSAQKKAAKAAAEAAGGNISPETIAKLASKKK